ncbi:MAG: hypothetical protein UU51_C0006G0020 [Microgenomates group bacterium GW2011_GWC1_41_20]|uniref:Uncharacterized protein n=7 Tax=Candidatus Woeseibacteriota TaxID=1752722 RepID=A0A0G0UZZ7_9BACT|nr:MAG: hypothetical protein UT76_C0005G0006 [Candidatus Woesebacteria bacterium GW2011_GWB1_40_12]KKR55892.1 MAG: hypothetical protein UT93_C0011G0006 [Candidatus Woesebacteria bacterium GW2011_GWF1_40_24]KKR89316.1 MAG: hypothetical protein UU39_C0043G0006 [Candidatus Woesebacteria bacterium GW2011_GWD1_41_12]KKS00497.1 MAG: hypothetical protein UU51_C0006G0020 [Microgenomates group bacterium GW2011_GWC1_41_20]KKS05635.1 MAG: hypothetical protein UU57_C0003G0026 [Candidatus Woesebacteria bact
MGNFLKIFSANFNFSLGKINLPIPYWQAITIVILLFVLVFMMAKFRRHYVDWSFKGAAFGVFFGFLLALILEGFLIIGGRTALTSILGWKNPPPAITSALDAGRSKLVQVLGINMEIPSSYANVDVGVEKAVDVLQSLNPADTKTVKAIFCK